MKYINSDQQLTFNNQEIEANPTDNYFCFNELNMNNIIKLLIPAEFLQIESL